MCWDSGIGLFDRGEGIRTCGDCVGEPPLASRDRMVAQQEPATSSAAAAGYRVLPRSGGTGLFVNRYIIAIEAPGWNTFEAIELPHLPEIGDPIDTQYGTLLVAEVEATPDGGEYAGKIVCRMS
jgi:hypothetical protein